MPEEGRKRLLHRLHRTPDGLSRSDFSSWGVRSSGDRVYAALGDGFTGVQLDLELRGDTLAGTGRTFSDTWPNWTRKGGVRGTRISCPEA